MKNELLTKGIILPSGEIGKDKINLVAGAITQPFAEMVWVTTGGDMETINRLTNVLVTMNNPTDRGKLFKIIKLLYGLMGLPFSEEAEPMDADPDVLELTAIILPLSLTTWQAAHYPASLNTATRTTTPTTRAKACKRKKEDLPHGTENRSFNF